LEQWAAEMIREKYASASIRRKFASIRVFFSYWVRRGRLDASPLWRIKLDLEREKLLPRNITAADAKRLLDCAWRQSPCLPLLSMTSSDREFIALRNLVIVEILFATGMRVGELVALSLPDWYEDEGVLVVNGKGGRQRLAVIPDKRSASVIRDYVQCRRTLELTHDALILNSRGERLSTQGVARTLAAIAKAAGVGVHLTPHMMRHTVATLLLQHGADIRVVQEVLGHASITMTQRYTHVSKEHLRATLQLHHPNSFLAIATRRASIGESADFSE